MVGSVSGALWVFWQLFMLVLTEGLVPRGSGSLTFEEGSLELVYKPMRWRRKSEAQFLGEIGRFSSKAMDRLLRSERIERVVFLADGSIPSSEASGGRTWKGVRLELDTEGHQLVTAFRRNLAEFAKVDLDEFFGVCSFEWIDASEFPKKPVVRMSG